MTKERIEFLRQMMAGTPAEFEECLDEIERLQSGRLTRGEFNELCHNLHERGIPMTWDEHKAACDEFRECIFNPMPGEFQ